MAFSAGNKAQPGKERFDKNQTEIKQIYNMLFSQYGPQHWWPGDSPFEIMVGAILTQNTAWVNVEQAIANLESQNSLHPQKILDAALPDLAGWLRPSGYFNVKARRLRNYCQWYVDAGGYAELSKIETSLLRQKLLTVNGVGPETADDILLYAFARPVFVIDAYTRRVFVRLGLVDPDANYETVRQQFEVALKSDAHPSAERVFNEYHALIVWHAKYVCKKRPSCEQCCLATLCPSREL